MKAKFYFILITMIAVLLAGCGANSTSQSGGAEVTEDNETIKLKVAAYFASTSPIYSAVTEPWMNKVTELTDGKVQFDYYPGEQLGKAGDLLKLTKDKVTDISITAVTYTPDLMPITNTLAGLPNLSETTHQGTMAYYDLLQENDDLLQNEYLNHGVRPILTHVSPTFEIWTTGKELRVPEDLKGVKIRTAGGVLNDVYEYLGAVPVAVPHAETYEAVEKGVIDAYSSYSMGAKSAGLEDLLEYGVFPHIGTTIHALTINEEIWKGLPEDVQTAMIQAGKETMELASEVYTKDTDAFNEDFVANGGTIAELTQEEQDQWKKVFDDFTKEWIKEHESDGLPYEDVINMYKEKLEQYKPE
ncbi:TRAP transporter substrate-binding protein DctP [Bacillus dakarensis]|uniref:TRAP transporter substrate-binding protein DctP n=1 Tax=Robertmurraya dakarensis TaxID=1926278 RepID=UPI000981A54A|nr:TRAP transporter substrate-binding protein DctP [Bacillus dakarensis]